MRMKIALFAVVVAFAGLAGSGCGKKKKDIKSLCETMFAKGNDSENPGGKGDKQKFMDVCLKSDPEVVRCSTLGIDFDDKSCKKVVGVFDNKEGFEAKQTLWKLRDGVQ